MFNFYEIAIKIGLASNQVEAIRALLCIKEDTYLDGRTLKLHAPDLPEAFRNWIYNNEPEQVFFSCPPRESTENDFDIEKGRRQLDETLNAIKQYSGTVA